MIEQTGEQYTRALSCPVQKQHTRTYARTYIARNKRRETVHMQADSLVWITTTVLTNKSYLKREQAKLPCVQHINLSTYQSIRSYVTWLCQEASRVPVQLVIFGKRFVRTAYMRAQQGQDQRKGTNQPRRRSYVLQKKKGKKPMPCYCATTCLISIRSFKQGGW